MRALLLLTALGPGAPEVDVAIGWHAEAKASAQLRQRLRAHVAEQVGVPVDAVEEDPTEIARRTVARELDRGLVERARAVGELLDEADAHHRAGEFEAATRTLVLARERLEEQPLLPGASTLARRAALLDARLQWAAAEADATDRALLRAIALDPQATLTTRDVPPALARRHEQLREQTLESRATWPTPTFDLGEGVEPGSVQIVIDGQPGTRAVPPGSHFLVAHRAGQAPVATLLDAAEVWVLPAPVEVVGAGLPGARAEGERMCAAAEFDELVLAHRRGDRLGLQAYRCGAGFGPRWVGTEGDLGQGVALVLSGGSGFESDRATLHETWPTLIEPRPSDPPDEPEVAKPWFRRAWVWVLVGGVVAGGVTTGAVLGTRARRDGVGVDADDFLRP